MNDVERELYREAGLPVDDDDPFRIDYAAELQAMKDEWAWVDAKFKAKKKAERRAAFIESLRTLELLAPLTKDQPELLSLESCRPGRTRHRYGWRHIKVDSHTLQSALPQGEHLPKCAEDIPSELFNNIIWHVNHLCLELPRKYEDVRYLVRQLRTDWKSSDDCLSSLKACSLVCRHWAAKSRQYMYSGSVLSICSKEDFEIALAFATRGCPTLAKTAILRAVRWIDVCQRYDTPRSFYHLLLHPLTRHRLRTIILQGPIPEQFPRCFVNTPHWRLPITFVTTPSYPRFGYSAVMDIHFPSFRHVVKYIKYFSLSPLNNFRNITWDKSDSDEWVPPSIKYRGVRGNWSHWTTTSASSCTDNSQLCLQAALTRPHCMLVALPMPERGWLLKVMRAYMGYYHRPGDRMTIDTWKFQQQGPEILLTMDGRQVGTSSTMSIFTTNPYRDGDDFEDFRVEGVLVYIEDSQLPVDLVALRKQLIAHESLRVVYFVFRAQSILWSMVRPMNLEGFGYIRSELQMPVEGDGPKFGLGCRRSKSLSYEEIDHIKGTYMDDSTTCFDMDLDTLQPTGEWWDDDDAMMFAFLGRE